MQNFYHQQYVGLCWSPRGSSPLDPMLVGGYSEDHGWLLRILKNGLGLRAPSKGISRLPLRGWGDIAAKELKLSYHNPETMLLFTIYTYYGSLNCNQGSCAQSH